MICVIVAGELSSTSYTWIQDKAKNDLVFNNPSLPLITNLSYDWGDWILAANSSL